MEISPKLDYKKQMNSGAVALILLGVFVVYVAFKFFTQSLANFLENGAKTFLWVWLPFTALRRLVKQLKEKYKK